LHSRFLTAKSFHQHWNECLVLITLFVTAAPAPSSGGATAAPPKANAAARSPVSATIILVATVVAPLLAFYYL
jgi:hypothetical protein